MTTPAASLASHPSWSQAAVRRIPLLAVGSAALLGLLILFGVGFAQPHFAHNAAHDARHAQGFPCH